MISVLAAARNLDHLTSLFSIRKLQSACENEAMQIEVECYSGHKADERPVRFRLDGNDYLVEELLDQWYGQSDTFFKVRADDGNLYILSCESSSPVGCWRLVSFRKSE
jgi:hypothetical protein